ncbi:hypothetical protein NIES4074_42570 [Cylindrospermum sp. NIES-4074]|nr:hypothetical protein NIES4074_42570 [Cylindrospermum sp. NIES-4074]
MSFYPELDGLNLVELIECFQHSYLENEESSVYYDEAAMLIRQQGEAGIAFLFGQIEKANSVQLKGILLALTFPPPVENPLLRSLLLTYLRDDRPLIIAEAIDGLRMLGAKDTVDIVLPLHIHPDPYVRGSVLRFMSRLYPNSSQPLLIEALQDPDYIVRENAIDELDDLGAVEAVANIRPLLTDSHPHVRQAAETAIQNLA